MTFIETARNLIIEDSKDEAAILQVLIEASAAYYNEAEECLADAEYDKLELMLKAINPKHPFFQEVGSDVRGGKVDLPVPMRGLDQVYENDTQKWIRENGWEDELFVISDKQDGTSALSVYGKGGQFKIAYSRGNGYQGADISRHVKRMVVFSPKAKVPCMIRQEVIIEDETFVAYKEDCQKNGKRIYVNPRNYVAGKMNASESDEFFYENVKVIGTSVIEPQLSKLDQFKFMEENGITPTHYITKKGKELTDDFLKSHLEERRKESDTAIDGLVIDLNDVGIRSKLENETTNPAYSKKFKIGAEDNIAYPKVISVSYEPSKHGYLKPRVHIEPTELAGVTISNITGHNAKFIKENNIGPGAIVILTRSGDVIPYIMGVHKGTIAMLPEESEFGKMSWSENEVDLIMEDSEHRSIILNQMLDMFGSLEIPNLKQGAIEKLLDAGITDPIEIIKMPEDDLKTIIGNAAGTKVFNGLKEKLNPIPLEQLAASSQKFGRGMGRKKLVKIIEHYGEDKFLSGKLTLDDIRLVDGFEITSARIVIDGMDGFKNFMAELEGYFTLEEKVQKSGDLDGVNFMFTGYRDKVAMKEIEERGGKIQSSVNKDTTYLVTKDLNSTSSKMKKAKDLGVKIIDPIGLKAILTK